MPRYEFVIIDEGRGDISPLSATPESVFDNVVKQSDTQKLRQGMETRLSDNLESMVLSPLNSATGGLAGPAYRMAKRGITGNFAGMGRSAMGLAFATTALIVKKLQERMDKMEAKAEEANNRDNLLLKMGMVQEATFYKGNLKGVRKIDRS